MTFIDTPGHGACLDPFDGMAPVLNYLQNQFEQVDKVFIKNVPLPELVIQMLSSGGFVDVVIYAVGGPIRARDLEFMQRYGESMMI